MRTLIIAWVMALASPLAVPMATGAQTQDDCLEYIAARQAIWDTFRDSVIESSETYSALSSGYIAIRTAYDDFLAMDAPPESCTDEYELHQLTLQRQLLYIDLYAYAALAEAEISNAAELGRAMGRMDFEMEAINAEIERLFEDNPQWNNP